MVCCAHKLTKIPYNFVLAVKRLQHPKDFEKQELKSSMASKSNSGSRPKKTTSTKKSAGPIPINAGNAGNGSNAGFGDDNSALLTNPDVQEEIRRRAYELYEERGRHEGMHQEDWTRAEAEVLSKYQQKEKSA